MKKKSEIKTVKIIPLGGIGEIGKNLTAIESQNDIIVVDCGLMFPTDEMLGIDYVIPDVSYLKKHSDKVRAFFISHGHEDHIGGIPYIIGDFYVPVYGSALTMALIESKLAEHDASADLRIISAGNAVDAGCFNVEFVNVSHSIDDAVAFAIKTPAGMLVHTGDFKMDLTPVGGRVIDLSRFAELGKKGVLALMSDSTNADREGYTVSESHVGETFVNYFKQAKGRIIVATFASNVHRLQQVIDAAKIYNKKICLFGRSMIKIVNVSRELGLLNVSDDIFVDLNDIDSYKDSQIVVLSTGSQGETMSGLVRMATDQHPKIHIKPNDLFILSATPIPGNERYVYNVVNLIYKKGASVINDSTDRVHVSGHACEEELKLMLTLVKPKYFIPVHGEYRHLYKHAALAEKLGIPKKNIFITELGSVVELSKNNGKMDDSVVSGDVYVDGLGVGDIGQIVIRDRQMLSNNGLVAVFVVISHQSGRLLSSPDIISRGFVYMRESEEIIEKTKEIVTDIIVRNCYNSKNELSSVVNLIRKKLGNYLYETTMRSPMILVDIKEI